MSSYREHRRWKPPEWTERIETWITAFAHALFLYGFASTMIGLFAVVIGLVLMIWLDVSTVLWILGAFCVVNFITYTYTEVLPYFRGD